MGKGCALQQMELGPRYEHPAEEQEYWGQAPSTRLPAPPEGIFWLWKEPQHRL